MRVGTLCVGIADYPAEVLVGDEQPLRFAERSAQDLHAAFQSAWPEADNCHLLLLGGAATAETVCTALRRVENCDLAILCLIGHARWTAEGGFGFVLATPNNSGPNLLDNVWLDAALAGLKAKDTLLLLDCCYSGRFAECSTWLGSGCDGRGALMSSRPDQQSWEDATPQRTLFTDALLAAFVEPLEGRRRLSGGLFAFLSDHVTRHAFGLKRGAAQDPYLSRGAHPPELVLPLLPSVSRGHDLGHSRVLARRVRQILLGVLVLALVGLAIVWRATWRPAIGPTGQLELRAGPKWMSPFGLVERQRVELPFAADDLTPDGQAEAQQEAGMRPWPGTNTAGVSRWADAVTEWLADDAKLRWRIRLGLARPEALVIGRKFGVPYAAGPGTGEAFAETALIEGKPVARDFALSFAPYRFGAACADGVLGDRDRQMAELVNTLSEPEDVVRWLRSVALAGSASRVADTGTVLDLVRTFNAMHREWEDSYAQSITASSEPLTAERVTQRFAERPTTAEIDALTDLAAGLAARGIVPSAAERSALVGSLAVCGTWSAPALAAYGRHGAPDAVRAWARSRERGDQGRKPLLLLAQAGLLNGDDVWFVFDRSGFNEGPQDASLGTAERWLASVASYQGLPPEILDRLIRYAGLRVEARDERQAIRALGIVGRNQGTLSALQKQRLSRLVGSLSQGPLPPNANLIEFWGTLGRAGRAPSRALGEGWTAKALADGSSAASELVLIEDGPGPTALHAGYDLAHVETAAALVLGAKRGLPVRSPKMLAALEAAAVQAVRAGRSDQELRSVFDAIASLAEELTPNRVAAETVFSSLAAAPRDWAARHVQIAIATRALAAPARRSAALDSLRRRWQREDRPELRYDVATLIIELARPARISR